MARAVRSGTRVDTALLVACCAMALLATVLPLNLREAIAGGLRRTVVAPLVSLREPDLVPRPRQPALAEIIPPKTPPHTEAAGRGGDDGEARRADR